MDYAYDGIYLPTEVSRYLVATMPATKRPPTSRRILRWIRAGLVAPERREAPGRVIVVNFGDLVTCQAITLLREAGISLRSIRKAEHYFSRLYGLAKPFAHREFWYSRPDIFGQLDGQLISGTTAGQFAFAFLQRWLEPVRKELTFAPETGSPIQWQPAEGISLRPTVQFGRPCIEGTRIPTGTIWSYVQGGDAPAFIAESFGIAVADVERAVAWERKLLA